MSNFLKTYDRITSMLMIVGIVIAFIPFEYKSMFFLLLFFLTLAGILLHLINLISALSNSEVNIAKLFDRQIFSYSFLSLISFYFCYKVGIRINLPLALSLMWVYVALYRLNQNLINFKEVLPTDTEDILDTDQYRN